MHGSSLTEYTHLSIAEAMPYGARFWNLAHLARQRKLGFYYTIRKHFIDSGLVSNFAHIPYIIPRVKKSIVAGDFPGHIYGE